ncbi:uncharacterized protein LOC119733733 [Patiria miniata]|uniref:HAT C-terminal dimerisation domain-containing protein n=1 Tax=Patiria miniata TaxID=46514 RepID=A0A914AGD7_PATMI|nr:uncharacterized protein LOC119733733 [Patiria miniata]
MSWGDKSATITQVVPVVLDINSHLSKWKDDARVCKTLVTALHKSLKKRFRGIFINCGMDTEPGSGSHQEPFIEKIYLVGAVLDPQYMLHWVDADVVFTGSPEKSKNKLKDTLKEMVITEAERFVSNAEEAASLSHTSSEEEDIPAKVPRLLAKYKTIRSRTKSGEKDSVRIQLEKYIRDEERHGLDAVTFWQDSGEGKNKYPSLHALAKNILCVPASSAPVERIFSRGGLIMRPHRARLTPQMLETLMFLKCNEHVL